MQTDSEFIGLIVDELTELMENVTSAVPGFEHHFVGVLDRLVDEIKSHEITAIAPHIQRIVPLMTRLLRSHPKWHMRMTVAVVSCHLIRDYAAIHPDIILGTDIANEEATPECLGESLLGALWSLLGHEKPEVRETVAQAYAAAAEAAPAVFDSALLGPLTEQLLSAPDAKGRDAQLWMPRETAAYALGHTASRRPDIASRCFEALVAGTRATQPPFYGGYIRQRSVEGILRLLNDAQTKGAETAAALKEAGVTGEQGLLATVDVAFTLAADEGIEARRAAAALLARAALAADATPGPAELPEETEAEDGNDFTCPAAARGTSGAAAAALRCAAMLGLDPKRWEPRFFAALTLRELAPWVGAEASSAVRDAVVAALRAAVESPVPQIRGQSPSQAHSEALVTLFCVLLEAPAAAGTDAAGLADVATEMVERILDYICSTDAFKIDGSVATLERFLATPVLRTALAAAATPNVCAALWPRLCFHSHHASMPIANSAQRVAALFAREFSAIGTDATDATTQAVNASGDLAYALTIKLAEPVFETAEKLARECESHDLRQGVFGFLHKSLDAYPEITVHAARVFGRGNAERVAELLLNHGLLSDLGMPLAEDARVAAARAMSLWMEATETFPTVQAPQTATIAPMLVRAAQLVGAAAEDNDQLAAAALDLVARVVPIDDNAAHEELLRAATAAAVVAAGHPATVVRSAAAAVAAPLLASAVKAGAAAPLTTLAAALPAQAPCFPRGCDPETGLPAGDCQDWSAQSRAPAMGLVVALAGVDAARIAETFEAAAADAQGPATAAVQAAAELAVFCLAGDSCAWEPAARAAGLALAARLVLADNADLAPVAAGVAALHAAAARLEADGCLDDAPAAMRRAIAGALEANDGPADEAEDAAALGPAATEIAALAQKDNQLFVNFAAAAAGDLDVTDFEQAAMRGMALCVAAALYGEECPAIAESAAAFRTALTAHVAAFDAEAASAITAPVSYAMRSVVYDAPCAAAAGRMPISSPLLALSLHGPACRWAAVAPQAMTAAAEPAEQVFHAAYTGADAAVAVDAAKALLARAPEAEADDARAVDAAFPLLPALAHACASDSDCASALAAALPLLENKGFRFDYPQRAAALALAFPAFGPLATDRARQAIADFLCDARLDEDIKLDILAMHVHAAAAEYAADYEVAVLPRESPVDLARENTAFAKSHVADQKVQ